jgi:hypothetical protein
VGGKNTLLPLRGLELFEQTDDFLIGAGMGVLRSMPLIPRGTLYGQSSSLLETIEAMLLEGRCKRRGVEAGVGAGDGRRGRSKALLKVFRTVGEAAGKALAVIASAVDDLPNVMGRDDVCKESLGRLLGAGCGARASISLVVSECSDVRLFVLPVTACVESAGAVGFIARASMSERSVLV